MFEEGQYFAPVVATTDGSLTVELGEELVRLDAVARTLQRLANRASE